MKGYRIGGPAESNAARVLTFELEELCNAHILDDLAHFLKVGGNWKTLIGAFRDRYGRAEGVWLTRSKEAARRYYGRFGGDLIEYEYDPKMIVSDLGDDGIFVLNPKFIGEVVD
jgi:hypothetical protein